MFQIQHRHSGHNLHPRPGETGRGGCKETASRVRKLKLLEECREAFNSSNETQSCREVAPAVQRGEMGKGQCAASMRTAFQHAGEVKQHMFNLLLLPGS